MTETLDPMAATEVDQKKLAEQLLAQAKEQGIELMGPSGLLNQLTTTVLEWAWWWNNQRLHGELGHAHPDRGRAGVLR